MRHLVLTPGAEKSATEVSLTAVMQRVHSGEAIPPARNFSLLMIGTSCVNWMCQCS